MRHLLALLSILSWLTLGIPIAQAQQVTPPAGATVLVCAYNTTPPTIATGNYLYVQCDANGKIITSGGSGGAGVSSLTTTCPSSGPSTGAVSLSPPVGRTVSAGSDSIVSTDCGSVVEYQNATSTAVALPSAASLGTKWCVTLTVDGTAGTVTVTSAGGNFNTTGNTTLTLAAKSWADICVNSAGTGFNTGVATSSTGTYTQKGVTLDYGAVVGTNNTIQQANAAITAGGNVTLKGNCPANVLPGMAVIDLSLAPTGGSYYNNYLLGFVATCSGTSLTLTHPGGSGSNHAGQGTTDSLAITGPIASGANCQFVFSGWWRGDMWSNVGTYTTNFNRDMFGGWFSPGTASSEQLFLNLVPDVNGLRINYSDSSVVAASSNNHNVNAVISYPFNLPAQISSGMWHHILWSANTCATNTQYNRFYVDGVDRTPSAQPLANTFNSGARVSTSANGTWTTATTAITLTTGGCTGVNAGMSVTDKTYAPPKLIGYVSTCSGTALTLAANALVVNSGSTDALDFNSGINFSQMAGLALGAPATGDDRGTESWADVFLWTNTDLVCQHGQWASGCSIGGNISAADLAMFGQTLNGAWVPKDPYAVGGPVATLGSGNQGYDGLLLALSGSASAFTANNPKAAAATPITLMGIANAGLHDLTSSASNVTSTNRSGAASHVATYKWTQVTNSGTAAAYNFHTDLYDVAVGDMLVGVYSAVYSASAAPTCSAAPSGAGGAWTLRQNTVFTNAGGSQIVCVYTYVAVSGDTTQVIGQDNGTTITSGVTTTITVASGTCTGVTTGMTVWDRNATALLGTVNTCSGTTLTLNAASLANGSTTTDQLSFNTVYVGGATSVAPTRGSLSLLMNYGNVSSYDTASSAFSTWTGTTNMSATSMTPTGNDTLVAIYATYSPAHPNYVCQNGWVPRTDQGYINAPSTGPELLICESQGAAGISTGLVTATEITSGQTSTGAIVGLQPN